MIRTDMALEAREMAGETEGVAWREEREDEITVTRVKILTPDAAEKMGKPIGTYVTVESPALAERDRETALRTGKILARELKHMADLQQGVTLVVGLGNRELTPDALGPMVVDRLFVTRQIKKYAPQCFDPRMGEVAALAPGVLGITGIETFEIVKGAVERVRPDRVICIDSLASRRARRITTSFQISDAGIEPGAGVSNRRKALNRESLGVPVLALGVPMVVDARTLVQDALEAAGAGDWEEKMSEALEGSLVVTPKEIDLLVADTANILAHGLNGALHAMPMREIEDFLY